ncbi:MaoC family dehydratase [Eilatimonas milleporae]|uniref:Acyl dehydratase n=1 Tax=Eilatimonas milleporae TaxID=911205 RepID=A0A3M0C4L1_9PROT|nr:MaoC family dehydratase [Eilatimonas milleporae]RMB04754.1 acyl dehydratase [Eilatimonas milleporae]
MAEVDLKSVNIGDALPPLETGPISRHTLALYCGGSGDHNPIHVDTDFAKEAGFDDVFVHGMLSMALLGRLLTGWTAQENIVSFGVRFSAITHVNDVVTASAKVIDKQVDDGAEHLSLDLAMHSQSGAQTLKGTAVIRIQ